MPVPDGNPVWFFARRCFHLVRQTLWRTSERADASRVDLFARRYQYWCGGGGGEFKLIPLARYLLNGDNYHSDRNIFYLWRERPMGRTARTPVVMLHELSTAVGETSDFWHSSLARPNQLPKLFRRFRFIHTSQRLGWKQRKFGKFIENLFFCVVAKGERETNKVNGRDVKWTKTRGFRHQKK